MVGPMAWESDLTVERFEFAGGALKVPEGAGLGCSLDRELVKKYLVREEVFAD